jgi:hypothetical protein
MQQVNVGTGVEAAQHGLEYVERGGRRGVAGVDLDVVHPFANGWLVPSRMVSMPAHAGEHPGKVHGQRRCQMPQACWRSWLMSSSMGCVPPCWVPR